ncbi:ABC transporter permease [candidate division KSB1 bacterium]
MNNKEKKLPRLGSFLLKILLPSKDTVYLLGDYKEIYRSMINERGRISARLWFWLQIFRTLPDYLKNSIVWNAVMFGNYLKIGLRNLKRDKAYSLLNIFALACGLAVFMICYLTADFGFNYDKFHANSDNLYGIVQVYPGGRQGDTHMAFTPGQLIPVLKAEFPEVEEGVRFYRSKRSILRYGERKFYETGILYTDPDFLSVFSFKIIRGNKETALSDPGSVAITESAALKYFGDEDPIGKILIYNKAENLRVSAVIEDSPQNSTIDFDFLLSLERADQSLINDWSNNDLNSFVVLKEGTDIDGLEDRIYSLVKSHVPDTPESQKDIYLLKLTDFFHRPANIQSSLAWNSPAELYIALTVGILFLLVVGVNYMSLVTARYLNRAKEIAMRKVVGAERIQIAGQFLGESVLAAVLALPLSFVFYLLLMEFFTAIWGQIYLTPLWGNPLLIIGIAGITILLGLFSGSYPALMVSGFRPLNVIRGTAVRGDKRSRGRNTLIIIQFSLSIIFVIFAFVVKAQFNFFIDKDLGFKRNNILIIPINQDAQRHINSLKESFLEIPEITGVSGAGFIPVKSSNSRQVILENFSQDNAWMMDIYEVDYDFTELLGVEIMTGRSFSRDYNDAGSVLINEEAVKQLNWRDPVGKRISYGNENKIIVGVVKDFHFKNLIYPIASAVLELNTTAERYIYIKFQPGNNYPELTEKVEQKWDHVASELPFDCFWLDHLFGDRYSDIKNSGTVFGFLGILAIVFAAIGLFGLASYTIMQRTKEIGIRKVLGASVKRLIRSLIFRFFTLVLISNAIALPIGYFFVKWLLQFGYAYSTEIRINIFVFTIAMTFLVAGLSVINQVTRAALHNPVDTLRYE